MIIIIMKSSFYKDCHYVIQRITGGFAITLYYHPAGLDDVVVVVCHLLYELLVFFSVFWVGGLGWWAGGAGGAVQVTSGVSIV
jgi:hypothetical protein